MIWVLMCLAAIGITWFMFVPRFVKNETLIPADDPAPGTDSAPETKDGGAAAFTGEVHPAHAYETGAHATGAHPHGHQPAGIPGYDAYVASAHPAGTPTAVGMADTGSELAGGAIDGPAKD